LLNILALLTVHRQFFHGVLGTGGDRLYFADDVGNRLGNRLGGGQKNNLHFPVFMGKLEQALLFPVTPRTDDKILFYLEHLGDFGQGYSRTAAYSILPIGIDIY
jgi:hypothetical protein